MERYIILIGSNPLYIAGAAILGIIIVVSLIKKVWNLLITAVLILGVYMGYLYYAGHKIPTTKKELIEHGSQQLDKLKAKGGEYLKDKVNEKVNVK